ncbi:unnamed protein product [Nezara viridula]|uniref:Uncharacterized protein n=1 Tax=Nezara viridula TaxID=85310 RepID=A0A9P0MQZ9_NEZVI|nr:unnamed protein product [Nezara viridula]
MEWNKEHLACLRILPKDISVDLPHINAELSFQCQLSIMKSLSVCFLAVLLIQASSGRPNDDSGEYEEHEEHSFVYSSTNPGQVQSTQTIIGRPPFQPMSFGFGNPGRQNFGNMFGTGGFGGFPSFRPLPGFPPLGQMSPGGFGGVTGQSFQLQHPGGFGQISGFTGPSSAGNAAFASSSSGSPGGSNSQLIIKPGGGLAFASSSSSSPGSNQVSISTQTSSSTDGQTSDKGEESEPSIAVEF